MAVQPRSNDELERAIDEIAFEVFHFRLYRKVSSSIRCYQSPVLSQALNYALLLHTRVLHEFLYGPNREKDLKPENFVQGWESPKTENSKLVDELHKRLAHLTWTRVEKPDKSAMNDYEVLMGAVEESIDAFEQALVPDLKRKYDAAIQARRTLYLNDPLLAEIAGI